MTGLILAQNTPPAPDLSPLVRRLVQGGLWTAPGSTARLFLLCLVWLVVLAVAIGLIQQDWVKWLRGLVDIRRHFEQLGAGLDILRRNKRPLWILLVGAVLSWTGWSLGVWQDPGQRTELETMLFVRENSIGSFAAAHSFTGALAPLRALVSLGDFLPLVLGVSILLFTRTAELSKHVRWEMRTSDAVRVKRRLGTIWVGLIILLGYRVVSFLANPAAPAVSGCLYIDSGLLPLILLAADGLLLSWVLTEFGRTLRGHLDWESDDTAAFVRCTAAAVFVCAVSNPGRYVVLACTMLEQQWTGAAARPSSRWGPLLWCSAIAQLVGLVWFAFPAVLVVSRYGGLTHKLRTYVTLLRRAGGQVAGLAVLAVLLNFLVTMPFYWIFGSMQPETWSLLGAASYGHYATLLLGLVLLAGVTQLAHQEVGLEDEPPPVPILLEPDVAAPAENAMA